MQKINYDLKMEEIIKENRKNGKKPSLLMQVCCAPCSTAVLERIYDDFKIDLFYYNPMIYPASELTKRVDTLEKIKEELGISSKIIFPANDINDFHEIAKIRKDDHEGGRACYLCYKLRLEEACKYALAHGYEYFSTTLSISPYKNSQWLNEIGGNLEEVYGVKYLYSDFKKKNGYKKSIDLSKDYGLYRQDYCGCIFSFKEMEEKHRQAE